jgi:hypothetical protein
MTLERTAPRRNTDRVDTLHEMLVRLEEARSEGSSAGGGGSHHEARMNTWDALTYTREYKELDRCLERLRWLAEHGRPMIAPDVSSAKAWWHIRHRYLATEVVRREVHYRRTHSGERVPARLPRNMEVVSRQTILNGRAGYMMVRVWDPRVDPAVVGAGLRWISREFRGTPVAVWLDAA